MIAGVVLAVTGTVLSVAFGAQGEGCLSIDAFAGFWWQLDWMAYFSTSVAVALMVYLGDRFGLHGPFIIICAT